MKNINLSLAALSLLIGVAIIFVQLHIAMSYTFVQGGAISSFFIILFGYVGKGLLLLIGLYTTYKAWRQIKLYHVLLEIPKLLSRSAAFIIGLLLITIGLNLGVTVSGIVISMAGSSLTAFLLIKWIVEMFKAYHELLKRRIVR